MSYDDAAVFAVDYLLALNKETRFVSFDDIEKAVAVAVVLYPQAVDGGREVDLRADINRVLLHVGPALIGEDREKRDALIRGMLQ